MANLIVEFVCAAGGGGGGGGGKKRPAWDLKGRLEDMEAVMQKYISENNELQVANQSRLTQIEQLEGSRQVLEGSVADREQRYTMATQQVNQLQQQLRYLLYFIHYHINYLIHNVYQYGSVECKG